MLLADNLDEMRSHKGAPERFDACNPVIEHWRELTAIINLVNKLGECGSIEELGERRSRIIEQIVEAPTSRISDAIVKVTILSSLVADGELQVGLTPQCLKECDRALAAEEEAEQCLRTIEPDLWTVCQRVRDGMVEASLDPELFSDSRWREFGDAVRAIARYEAMTPAGLKAKGEIFQEVFQFASTIEGLRPLQMSYMQDFRFLAYYRMHGKHSSVPREVMC